MRLALRKMTEEELQDLVRACAREIAWRKELERRAQARVEGKVGLRDDLLALARRANLREEELQVLLG